MPTPQPIPADGDPPNNLAGPEQALSQPQDYEPDETTGTENQLPESVPSRGAGNP
jgi:hypothetical protein